MTWPETPGPEEWYLSVVPCKPPEGSWRFDSVFFTIRCKAFPAHICDFRCVRLTNNHLFESQFDDAFKAAMTVVRRLNMESYREVTPDFEPDMLCANCGESACYNDYLCSKCRCNRDN